jgi:FkbM family methyltransferase
MRFTMRHWPLPRGKGVLMRLFRPLLRGREFLMEVEPGIVIPAMLDDYMVYWVFVNDYVGDAVVRLSRSLIRPGATVIDVGANIGLWVMGAAARAGDSGNVHAIEPVPENYTRLCSNLKLNRLEHVQCKQAALSNRRGRVTMFKPRYNNSGHPSLGARQDVDIPVEVPTLTLDDYCAEHGIRHVDLIKVDVEGAELYVLQGGSSLLRTPEAPAILFEVNEDTAARLGSSTAAVKSLLRTFGYKIFSAEGGHLREVAVERPEQPGDLFAFKPAHLECFPQLSGAIKN